MLGEFFRRRGWSVQLLTPHDIDDVLAHLRRDWFDAVGLSVSTGRQLAALGQLMPRLRAESPNERLCVLVGGPLVGPAGPARPGGGPGGQRCTHNCQLAWSLDP